MARSGETSWADVSSAQPVMPWRPASAYTNGRKPTPCTTPRTLRCRAQRSPLCASFASTSADHNRRHSGAVPVTLGRQRSGRSGRRSAVRRSDRDLNGRRQARFDRPGVRTDIARDHDHRSPALLQQFTRQIQGKHLMRRAVVDPPIERGVPPGPLRFGGNHRPAYTQCPARRRQATGHSAPTSAHTISTRRSAA